MLKNRSQTLTLSTAGHEFVLSDGNDACLNFDKVLKSVKVTANELYDGPLTNSDINVTDQKEQKFLFAYEGEQDCNSNKALVWERNELEEKSVLYPDASSGIGFPEKLLDGLGLGLLTEGSFLGESNSEESGSSIYVGVGPAGNTSDKSISGGIKAGQSFLKNQAGSTLIDITGDGIDDILYRSDKGLRYCAAARQPNGHIKFSEERCGREVHGPEDIGISSSSIVSAGVEAHIANTFVGIGYNSSNNNTYVYFTDRDGDSLIDVVVYGKVHYGQGEICEGEVCSVAFKPKSALVPPLPGTYKDENKTRLAPGYKDTLDRMGATLASVSRRLDPLSYSQTSIAWQASLSGDLVLEGHFKLDAIVTKLGKEFIVADGFRSFKERQAKSQGFEEFYNDCDRFNHHPHCANAALPEASFDFIQVPPARIKLEISRSRKSASGEYKSNLQVCGQRDLPRGGKFDISELLEHSPCAEQSNSGWIMHIESNDVLYLTYTVHPDFTASLAPNANVSYVSVDDDADFGFEPIFGDFDIDEILPCTWMDQFGARTVSSDCLLGDQTRYTFNLATGLLTTNPRSSVPIPQGSKRQLLGRFNISTKLARDYDIYFDIYGSKDNLAWNIEEKLPLLYRQDISESCASETAPICEVTLELVCATSIAVCAEFEGDVAPAYSLAARLNVEHRTKPGLSAENLNSRLTSLVLQLDLCGKVALREATDDGWLGS